MYFELVGGLGFVALVLLVSIILYSLHRKAVYVGNLIASLTLFMCRSCLIYFVSPIVNIATVENQGIIGIMRDSLFYLLGWVVISAILVIVMNIIVPEIHKNFTVVKTPPGQPDKVVQIDRRRSA